MKVDFVAAPEAIGKKRGHSSVGHFDLQRTRMMDISPLGGVHPKKIQILSTAHSYYTTILVFSSIKQIAIKGADYLCVS